MPTDPTGRISHLPDMHRDVSWKTAVRAATTANITLSGTQTIDGVACVAGDRVLVKNNSTGSQNGIYDVAAGAWTRSYDFDQDGTTAVPGHEIVGAIIRVTEGTTNAGTIWLCTNTGTPTLGTTSLTFSQFASGGGVTGFATPAIVLGTAAAAGAATTVIRSDSTVVAFDSTVPVNQALGDSAATGSVAFAARRDHKHGMPALSTATPLADSSSGAVGTGTLSSREDHVHPAAPSTGELLISDTPSTPLVFADILQNDAQTDFLYAG